MAVKKGKSNESLQEYTDFQYKTFINLSILTTSLLFINLSF